MKNTTKLLIAILACNAIPSFAQSWVAYVNNKSQNVVYYQGNYIAPATYRYVNYGTPAGGKGLIGDGIGVIGTFFDTGISRGQSQGRTIFMYKLTGNGKYSHVNKCYEVFSVPEEAEDLNITITDDDMSITLGGDSSYITAYALANGYNLFTPTQVDINQCSNS